MSMDNKTGTTTTTGSSPKDYGSSSSSSSTNSKQSGFKGKALGSLPDWMKKMPSRNTILFLSTVSLIGGMFAYDRYEASRLKKEYKELVRWRGDQPLAFDAFAPKVQVYSTRLPDDDEAERSLIFWKKYVKPLLVSAGVDYSILHGDQPGALSRRLIEKYHARRLQEETGESKAEDNKNAGEAGADDARPIVGTFIIGRNTFKEYMYSLKQGWLEPLEILKESIGQSQDERLEEELSKTLEKEDEVKGSGPFDEAPVSDEVQQSESFSQENNNTNNEANTSPLSPPYNQLSHLSGGGASPWNTLKQQQQQTASPSNDPPAKVRLESRHTLPQQAPMVLIPFDHPLSRMRWWPQKIYSRLFCERHRVQKGAEAALTLLQFNHREFQTPTHPEHARAPDFDSPILDQDGKILPQIEESIHEFSPAGGDCDFDHQSELHYHKQFHKWPKSIEEHRKFFYKELPDKVKVARELARLEREPTKAEQNDPPETEVELREQRLKKEKRWRNNERAWRLTRAGSNVTYDERMSPSSLPILVANGNVFENEKSLKQNFEEQHHQDTINNPTTPQE